MANDEEINLKINIDGTEQAKRDIESITNTAEESLKNQIRISNQYKKNIKSLNIVQLEQSKLISTIANSQKDLVLLEKLRGRAALESKVQLEDQAKILSTAYKGQEKLKEQIISSGGKDLKLKNKLVKLEKNTNTEADKYLKLTKKTNKEVLGPLKKEQNERKSRIADRRKQISALKEIKRLKKGAIGGLGGGLAGIAGRKAGIAIPSPGAIGAKLGGAGNVLKTMAPLSKAFAGLSTVVGFLSKAFTGIIGAVIMLVVALDGAAAEFNKKLLKGVGVGIGGPGGDPAKQLNALLNMTNELSLSQHILTTGLKLTRAEVEGATSAMLQSGATASKLGGNMEALKSMVETTATVSRSFGMTMEEAGRLTGDYFKAFSVGAVTMKETFAIMSKGMKEAGMTSTNFLAIMQSITAQMNLFLDSSAQTAKVLGTLGKTGAFSQKQMSKLMNTLTGVGTKTFAEGYAKFATLGQSKEAKDIVAEKLDRMTKELSAGQDQMTVSQIHTRMLQIKALQDIKEAQETGNILQGGAALGQGLNPFDELNIALQGFKNKGLLGKKGEKLTSKQLYEAIKQTKNMEIMAAYLKKTPEEIREMIIALAAVTAETGSVQNALKDVGKLEEVAAEKQQQRDAEALASMSTTKLSGLGEITNNLLMQLLSLVKWIGSLMPWKKKKLPQPVIDQATADKKLMEQMVKHQEDLKKLSIQGSKEGQSRKTIETLGGVIDFELSKGAGKGSGSVRIDPNNVITSGMAEEGLTELEKKWELLSKQKKEKEAAGRLPYGVSPKDFQVGTVGGVVAKAEKPVAGGEVKVINNLTVQLDGQDIRHVVRDENIKIEKEIRGG